MDYYPRNPHISLTTVLDTHSTNYHMFSCSTLEGNWQNESTKSLSKSAGSSLRLWLLGQNRFFLRYISMLLCFPQKNSSVIYNFTFFCLSNSLIRVLHLLFHKYSVIQIIIKLVNLIVFICCHRLRTMC